jgi:hypothetical protein
MMAQRWRTCPPWPTRRPAAASCARHVTAPARSCECVCVCVCVHTDIHSLTHTRTHSRARTHTCFLSQQLVRLEGLAVYWDAAPSTETATAAERLDRAVCVRVFVHVYMRVYVGVYSHVCR